MPLQHPTPDRIRDVFASRIPCTHKLSGPNLPRSSRLHAQSGLYPNWSVVEDAKEKGKQLSTEAARELESANAKVRKKSGTIELYSPKYYGTCTLGGLLACVSFVP